MTDASASGIALAIAVAVLTWGGALRSETLTCDDPLVTVDAVSRDLALTTCRAVASAKDSLEVCGLVQSRAILVSVVREPMHPLYGVCLGVYDSSTDCLQIAEPEQYSRLLTDRDARRDLPPPIIFSGLIAHELAHALVAQTADEKKIAPADHEFIASVFEMEAYGQDARNALLAADPVRPGGSRDMVNPGIYALAPRVFANNAWQLFQAADDGCALIQNILSGTHSLSFK